LDAIKEMVWKAWDESDAHRSSLRKYWVFWRSSSWWVGSEMKKVPQTAIALLMKARCNALPTCKRLAQMGVVGNTCDLKKQCPFCFQNVPEDLKHMLIQCPRWAQDRKEIEGKEDVISLLGGSEEDIRGPIRRWENWESVAVVLERIWSRRKLAMLLLQRPNG